MIWNFFTDFFHVPDHLEQFRGVLFILVKLIILTEWHTSPPPRSWKIEKLIIFESFPKKQLNKLGLICAKLKIYYDVQKILWDQFQSNCYSGTSLTQMTRVWSYALGLGPHILILRKNMVTQYLSSYLFTNLNRPDYGKQNSTKMSWSMFQTPI